MRGYHPYNEEDRRGYDKLKELEAEREATPARIGEAVVRGLAARIIDRLIDGGQLGENEVRRLDAVRIVQGELSAIIEGFGVLVAGEKR